MVARSPSGHWKQLRRWHLAGTLPATTISVALFIMLLAVAGCGRTAPLTGSSGAHATVTPTSSILQGTALPWVAGNLPPGNTMMYGFDGSQEQDNLEGLFIAPSDGNIAYSCVQSTSAAVEPSIWVTHDRAQHWTQVGALPPVAQQLTVCNLFPDAVDPSIVVASVSWARPKDLLGAPSQVAFTEFRDFITFDGGAHWQALPGSEPVLLEWLATYHGTTLAEVESSSGVVNLEMSTDRLRTWHQLPQVPIGQPWINPATGDLLAFGETGSGPGQVYQSSDLGQHWTALSLPSALGGVLISPPMADQPLRMCGIATSSTPSPIEAITTPIPDVSDERVVMCSMDGGKTWTERPNLITTVDNIYKGTFPQAAEVVAIGADGSVYAQMPFVSGSYLILGIPSGLYRLAPQATRWQLLGWLPPAAVATTNMPGGGILWALGNDFGAAFAGPLPAAG